MTNLEAIIGAAGSGKNMPFTEPICTPEGFVPMGDIKKGSLVITKEGTAAEVLQTFPQEDLEMYRVTFSDNTWSECCIDHLWLIQTRKMITNKTYKVLSLRDMLPNINKFRKTKQGHYYSIPLCQPIEFYYQPLPIHPYTLGYLIGNGGFSSLKSTVTVHCHLEDSQEILNLISERLPQDTHALSIYTAKGTNSTNFRLSFEIKKYLLELNLLGLKSGDKFVPDIYKYNTAYNRLELLRGLCDSDGSVYLKQLKDGGTKKTSFNNTSYRLMEDVAFLVRSLGGISSEITKYERKERGSVEYNMTFRLPDNPFKLQRKYDLFNSVETELTWTKKIVSAEYIGQKDGQCILVNHPSHTYLTRDFIVTHNTYVINQRLKEDPSYCFRTASSGIAAVNMSSTAGGNTATTINSALGYFNTANLLHKVVTEAVNTNLERIAKHYKFLALDEISLVEAAQVDLICLALDNFNKGKSNPLGLLVSGDAGQLPAVSGRPFFDAKNWSRFNITYLTEIKRQQDKEFIESLMHIRRGNILEAVDWFETNIGFEKRTDSKFPGSTFFSKNSEVDRYNFEALIKLPGKSKKYKAVLTGTPHPTWKDIPEYVELKQGALIQILVNNLQEGYANGDMGFVEEMYENNILIRLIRTGRNVYIPFTTLLNQPVGSRKSIGSLRSMRVRLAWSVSAHKSQGLTLDAAQIRVGDPFLCRSSGMLYVMLSRVRTKEGLRIVGTKDEFIKSCFVDERYKKWIH